MGESTKPPCWQCEGRAGLSTYFVATTVQSFSRQGNKSALEPLMNSRRLTPPQRFLSTIMSYSSGTILCCAVLCRAVQAWAQ